MNLCSKCGSEPRAAGGSWCLTCKRSAQAARRAHNRAVYNAVERLRRQQNQERYHAYDRIHNEQRREERMMSHQRPQEPFSGTETTEGYDDAPLTSWELQKANPVPQPRYVDGDGLIDILAAVVRQAIHDHQHHYKEKHHMKADDFLRCCGLLGPDGEIDWCGHEPSNPKRWYNGRGQG